MRDSFIERDEKADRQKRQLPPALDAPLGLQRVPNPFGSPSPSKPESGYANDHSPSKTQAQGSPGARARLVSDIYG